MIRGTLTIICFVSTVLFPWPLTVLLSLVVASLEPLVPLAVGLFADTLYYSPQAGALPIFTLCGAFIAGAAFFVRGRLLASNIER